MLRFRCRNIGPLQALRHKLNTTNATPFGFVRLLFFFFIHSRIRGTDCTHWHLNACNTFILNHISRLPDVIVSYSCDVYKKRDGNFKANAFITSIKKKTKTNWIRELRLPCRVKQQKERNYNIWKWYYFSCQTDLVGQGCQPLPVSYIILYLSILDLNINSWLIHYFHLVLCFVYIWTTETYTDSGHFDWWISTWQLSLNLPFKLVENNKKVQIFEEIWFVFHVGGSLQGFIKTIKLRSCIGK